MATINDYDRRRASRALTAALVEIVDEHDDRSMCVLEDLSTFGACIHCDIAVRTGSKVTLKAENVVHPAIVRHCKAAGDGYSVGLDFVDGGWTTPIEHPIHWMMAGNED